VCDGDGGGKGLEASPKIDHLALVRSLAHCETAATKGEDKRAVYVGLIMLIELVIYNGYIYTFSCSVVHLFCFSTALYAFTN
jgi:hypothetical protein